MVTIGIPFFNAEKTLGFAIQSILCQTEEDWELLLVDDGSTDGSLGVARSFDDPRIQVLSDGSNLGLVGRLNQIAHAASRDLVARMDSDDLMHPERIERQVSVFAGHEELDLVSTGAYVIDENGAVVGSRGVNVDPPSGVPEAIRGIIHPSVMYRKAWIVRHQYRARYVRSEDFELWCRALPTSRYTLLAEPLLFYRDPERIRLDPYRRSLQSSRAILREYGTEVFGQSQKMRLILRSVLREAIGLSLHALGLDAWLTDRRNVSLSVGAVEDAERVLNSISAACGRAHDIAS